LVILPVLSGKPLSPRGSRIDSERGQIIEIIGAPKGTILFSISTVTGL
jgi:hypothetical protein